MSPAASLFALPAQAPVAGTGAPAPVAKTAEASEPSAFAGLLDTATHTPPAPRGFLKTQAAAKPTAPTQNADAASGLQVSDVPALPADPAVDAAATADGSAPSADDGAEPAADTAPAEAGAETGAVTVALLVPTPVQPVVVAAEPAAQTGASSPAPALDGALPEATVPATPATDPAEAAQTAAGQAAAAQADATEAARPVVGPPAIAAEVSAKAAKTAAVALPAGLLADARTDDAEALPVAPALKAEAKTGNAATAPAAVAPSATPAPASAAPQLATSDAPAQTTQTAPTGDTAQNLPAADAAPADPAAPVRNDAQTAATPAAAREAAQPQTTLAALASTLSRATIETTTQLSAQILRRLEGRSTHFDMVLTPDALGRVEVSVDIDSDGQLAARLAFDNPAAAIDMRGRADELRRQLEDAGFRVSDDSLNFTDRDSGRSGDQRQDGAARRFASAARIGADADAVASPVRWMSMNLTPDRVDVRV